MVRLIVWSKDRACQLQLLLESIKEYADGLFKTHIIWTASDIQYRRGYHRLMQWCAKHMPSAYFIAEKDFREDTLKVMRDNPIGHVAFSTDDTVLFKPFPINGAPLLDFLPLNGGEVFSLRLGFNTLMQNCHTGQYQPPLSHFYKNDVVVNWDSRFYHPNDNYGYPFGLDMHIYKTKEMLERMEKLAWNTSNQLESSLYNLRDQTPFMTAFHHSVAVNIPMNNLSTVTVAGQDYAYSNEELNELYLKEQVINLKAISREKFIGAHQEVKLEFIDG